MGHYTDISKAIKEEIPDATFYLNEVPNSWKRKGNYKNLLPSPNQGMSKIMPRLGAFEITTMEKNTHLLLFSKLKSLVWPDYRLFSSTVKRFAKQKENLETAELLRKFEAQDKVQMKSRWRTKESLEIQPPGRVAAGRRSQSNIPTSNPVFGYKTVQNSDGN